MKNKRLVLIIVGLTILLLIPFIAMQFTNEVKWTLMDFVVAGVLLLSAGLVCELVFRKIKKISSRIAVCAVVLFVLVLVWAELAVGIFEKLLSGN